MLPGYSFNPRPNNSANGTADSVMDIGSSINGYYVMIDKFILLCKFYIKTVHINTLFTLTRLNVSLINELSFWKRSIFFLRDEACLESIKGRQSISVLWLKKTRQKLLLKSTGIWSGISYCSGITIFDTREARLCTLEAQPRRQGFLVFQYDAILRTEKALGTRLLEASWSFSAC